MGKSNVNFEKLQKLKIAANYQHWNLAMSNLHDLFEQRKIVARKLLDNPYVDELDESFNVINNQINKLLGL